MIISKIKKFAHYIRQGGIYEVLLRLTAVEYLPSWLLFVCEARILCLDTSVMQFVALQISDYEYGFADRHRFDGLLACSSANMRTTLQRLFNIFSQEDFCCHAMKHDGEIIAYCWTFERRYTLTFDDYRRSIPGKCIRCPETSPPRSFFTVDP